jgi:hypothetical protein
MPKLESEKLKRESEKLKRLTETVLEGRSKTPWPWALLCDHFPAETDEESREKLEAWAKENAVDLSFEEEQVRIGQARHRIRVVVLEPRRRPPIRRRARS